MKTMDPALVVMGNTDFEKVKSAVDDLLDYRLQKIYTIDRIKKRVYSMLMQACAEERTVDYLCLRVVYLRTNIGYHLKLEVWKQITEEFFHDRRDF